MNKITKAKEKYYKPTPKKWRKIGDTIQDISFIVGGIVIFTSNPIVGFISMALGRVGKIITNFATD